MAQYKDPTIAPGAPIDRPAVDPRVPVAASGMSRWIWIAAAAVVALFVLMMAFGGSDDVTTAPVDGGAVVTEPAAPAVEPAAPATPAPAAPAN